ncbi:hypothetical protein MTO96_051893 [Rhipicephalus appendiculatus]
MCPLKYTSRVTSGAASPSCAELLPGFVAIDSWDAVQANTYAILGHGPLIGRQVDHWCMAPDHLSFLSAAAWKNLSVPIEADGSYSQCTMYDPPVPVSDEQNRTNRIAVPCHQWGYDIANTADSIVSRFNLVCDRKYLYDLSSLSPILVSALVAPLLGLTSDRVGRKPVMLACAFAQLLATIGCSFSETYSFFVFTRVLLFVTADVTFLNTFILIHEVTGNTRRTTFTILDTAVPGIIVPPLMHALSLLELRWMLAQALPVIGGVMLASWCYLLEESPAWLIATRHTNTAEKVVLLAAKENGVDVAKARATFRVIKVKLDEDPPQRGSNGSRVGGGLKVAVSGAAAVTFCYTAETFPTAVRNVGISLAHLAGGVGNVVAIAVILVTEQQAGHVFYALSTFMVLLSVAAIQWLPEVYVERPPRAGSVSSLSVQERKAALVASLSSGIPSHRHKESRTRYSVAY